MSDITIPGVNNRFFSQEQIDKIIEAEAAPVRRLERQVETQEAQKRAWQEVNRNLSALQSASNRLFGIDSPFRSRIANSSNELILTASASRSAEEDRVDVIVRQTAAADRFSSNPIARDLQVPEGTYTFTIGDREHSLRYRGGNLENFITSLNRRMGDHIRTRVVQDTPSTSRFIIESLHEGADNTLGFEDDAVQFALDIGLIEEARSSEIQVQLPGNRTEAIAEAESKLDIPLPSLEAQDLRIEMEVRITSLPEEERSEITTPPGPELPGADSITLRGVSLRDHALEIDLPDMTPPEPPPVVEDPNTLFIRSGSREFRLPAPRESGEYETVNISLRDLQVQSPDSLEIRNRNSLKEVSVRNIRLYDAAARGDYQAVNPLTSAQDAIVRVDGIDFQRPQNRIDDIIPGTTLNLRRASAEPVEVQVGPDREASKDAIIEFAGYYNQLFTEVLILSRADEEIVNEIAYFTTEERETALERLGMMRGDNTLNQLIRSLQNATSAAYPTEDGQGFSMMSQIGVSTNAAGGNRGFDPSNLRGYLQIDENLLDEALQSDFNGVRRLFGFDSNSDGAVNSGVAFEVNRLTRPYTQTGGIIATRTSTIDSSIARNDRQIETYNERLERSADQLRREFARMEGAIQQMESNAQRFESMNPNNNR
ncbi:flagellar filament capping protein FliD [Spirochaeta dissipatitropha]